MQSVEPALVSELELSGYLDWLTVNRSITTQQDGITFQITNHSLATFGRDLCNSFILYSLNDSLDQSSESYRLALTRLKQRVGESKDPYLLALTAIVLGRAGRKFDAWMIAYRLSFEMDPSSGKARVTNQSLYLSQGEDLVLETTCLSLQALMIVDSQKFSRQIESSMEYILGEFLYSSPSATIVCLRTIETYSDMKRSDLYFGNITLELNGT